MTYRQLALSFTYLSFHSFCVFLFRDLLFRPLICNEWMMHKQARYRHKKKQVMESIYERLALLRMDDFPSAPVERVNATVSSVTVRHEALL